MVTINPLSVHGNSLDPGNQTWLKNPAMLRYESRLVGEMFPYFQYFAGSKPIFFTQLGQESAH